MRLRRRRPDKVEGARYDLVQLLRNERARLAEFDHEVQDEQEGNAAVSDLLQRAPPIYSTSMARVSSTSTAHNMH